jgi:hypothetical protein
MNKCVQHRRQACRGERNFFSPQHSEHVPNANNKHKENDSALAGKAASAKKKKDIADTVHTLTNTHMYIHGLYFREPLRYDVSLQLITQKKDRS